MSLFVSILKMAVVIEKRVKGPSHLLPWLLGQQPSEGWYAAWSPPYRWCPPGFLDPCKFPDSEVIVQCRAYSGGEGEVAIWRSWTRSRWSSSPSTPTRCPPPWWRRREGSRASWLAPRRLPPNLPGSSCGLRERGSLVFRNICFMILDIHSWTKVKYEMSRINYSRGNTLSSEYFE